VFYFTFFRPRATNQQTDARKSTKQTEKVLQVAVIFLPLSKKVSSSLLANGAQLLNLAVTLFFQ